MSWGRPKWCAFGPYPGMYTRVSEVADFVTGTVCERTGNSAINQNRENDPEPNQARVQRSMIAVAFGYRLLPQQSRSRPQQQHSLQQLCTHLSIQPIVIPLGYQQEVSLSCMKPALLVTRSFPIVFAKFMFECSHFSISTRWGKSNKSATIATN